MHIDKVLQLFNKKRTLLRLEERLFVLKNYDRGAYVEKLGIKPDTPCFEVSDTIIRAYVFKMTVELGMGRKPKGAIVCHRCDNRKCVRLEHLFWGTNSDNVRDSFLKGRRKKGRGDTLETIAKLEDAVHRLRKEIDQVEAGD